MTKHEEKYCPRCKKQFECKVGSIVLCQCMSVKLDEAVLAAISKKYEDCLCANCMQILKTEYDIQLQNNATQREEKL